jgi:hypothetical protein
VTDKGASIHTATIAWGSWGPLQVLAPGGAIPNPSSSHIKKESPVESCPIAHLGHSLHASLDERSRKRANRQSFGTSKHSRPVPSLDRHLAKPGSGGRSPEAGSFFRCVLLIFSGCFAYV